MEEPGTLFGNAGEAEGAGEVRPGPKGGGRTAGRTKPPASPDAGSPGAPGRVRAWVSGLRENQRVEGEVYLIFSKARRTRSSGEPFLALELSDRTGRIQARAWENVDALDAVAAVDRFVRVAGKVRRFHEALSLNLEAVEPVPDGEFDLTDFLPASVRDAGEMVDELGRLVAEIGSPPLRELAGKFFGPKDDPEFMRLFCRAPAAEMIHHAVLGGLLEHTLSVAGLCLDIGKRYRQYNRDLNLDLLLTGALLHDVGKVRELTWTRSFGYSDEGRLIGHIVIGAEMVLERARKVSDFPPETLTLLRHVILSHHGLREWGSPEEPKTVEAMILHHADNLDGKIYLFRGAARATGEDEGPESRWTYNKVLRREVYRREEPRE